MDRKLQVRWMRRATTPLLPEFLSPVAVKRPPAIGYSSRPIGSNR
jgi:hypothetical protein